MIGRILVAVACLLAVAVIACGIMVFMAQTSIPAAGRPKAQQPTIGEKPTAKATAPAPKQPNEDGKNAAESPAPASASPSIPGAPDRGKSYSLSEAEKALNETRSKSSSQLEFREGVDAWYVFLADPSFTKSEDYKEHREKLAALATESPELATPHIALAQAILHDAWNERGAGPDHLVAEEARRQFRAQAAEARKHLEKALEIGVKDPEAHSLLLEIARIEGWPLAETRAVFDQGRKIDPQHSALYYEMADYLLPRWHGQPGDVERFAAEMAQSMPGDDGLDAYMHIAYSVNQYDSNLLFWGKFDRELLAKGAEVIVKRYPTARNLVPFAALCTMAAQDRDAARRIRPAVKHKDAFRVWLWEHAADGFQYWCDAAEIDSHEAEWIWGAPTNYPGVAFAPDSKAIWCMTGVGRRAVALWNLNTKKVDRVLSARGNLLDQFVVDDRKHWVAATLGGEQRTGWMLWNLAVTDGEPYVHATKEACEAIAISPKSPLVAFASGQTVRTIEMAAKVEAVSMDIGERVRGITISGDGKLLAVWGESFSVWDLASGQKRFDLPRATDSTKPQIACEKIIDFDDEGRLWAIVHTVGAHPVQRSLVRFRADGKSWDIVIANLHNPGPVQPLTAVLSPDRRWLAISDQPAKPGERETVQVWNIATGKSRRLSGDGQHIGGMGFSPDGTKLATVTQVGGALKIWNMPAERSN